MLTNGSGGKKNFSDFFFFPFLNIMEHFTVECYFEITTQVGIRRNPGLYNHMRLCVYGHTHA